MPCCKFRKFSIFENQDMKMRDEDRDRMISYSSRLTVVVQGCQSVTCPFKPESLPDGMVGTANICDCKKKAKGLVKAIALLMPE